MSDSNTQNRDTNPDPITGEPGSHPVGTGIGAAGGGASGAAIGSVAGPVGTVIGAVVGAVAGGLAGKATAEAIDPSAEDAYWRENHGKQPFGSRSYDEYQPAYRTGYMGFGKHQGRKFDEAETDLRSEYEASGSRLGWDEARPAAHAAWSRLERGPRA
ncbi:MAG TPA: hypothetical protein VF614_12820 [Chthoniobacteraceae bacterium]